jgi:aspartate/tyrosine/aromatic aminotransferase
MAAKPAPVAANPTSASSGPVEFQVKVAPPDPILVTAQLFNQDTHPQKVNLGIGAYRTEKGKPWVLPSVKAAEMIIAQDPEAIKEYLAIDGLPELKKTAQELVFSPATLSSGRVASCQALSGTGALRVAGEFLNSQLGVKKLYHSDPTWGNHTAIFGKCNMKVETYPYYKPATRGFDFEGMIGGIKQMEPGSVILLHACAHNPTGVDPTHQQWPQIVEAIKAAKLIPLLDNAYQGYASGDLDKDNFATKLFEQSGIEFVLTQSFAKNFGLYGERIGVLHFVCADKERADAVLSQVKLVVRPMYSSPPKQGAALVAKVLGDPKLKKQWMSELKEMSDRIVKMRLALRKRLEELGTPGTWNHITDQIGMFSFTGLSVPQCERLQNEFHIYLLKSGRISMAGLNEGNINYFAEKIDKVVRENPAAKM